MFNLSGGGGHEHESMHKVVNFAHARMHQEIQFEGMDPHTDHGGFISGYMAALYDVVDNAILREMGLTPEHPMYETARSRVINASLNRIARGVDTRAAEVEREIWKVPTE